MVAAKVTVVGLNDFRRELRRLDRALGVEMRKIHLKVSKLVAGRARRAAPPALQTAIRDSATQKAAFVGTVPKPGYALAWIWGARRRTGWYAKGRYHDSPARQFPAWVGNQWDPGELGGSPYYIGPAINQSIDEVVELYGDEIEDLSRRAFPERR